MLKSFLTFTVIAIAIFGALAFSNNHSFRAILSSHASAKAEITHGPIVGGVTSTNAIIWVRLGSAAGNNYIAKISPQISELKGPGVTPNSKIQRLSGASSDNVYRVNFDSLAPNTRYYVNFFAENTALLKTPSSFKTFAAPGNATDFKFNVLTDFGTNRSSQVPVTYHVDTFKQAATETPQADFVFIGGDFWHTNLGDDYPNPNQFELKNRQFYKAMYSLNNELGDYNDFVKHILPNFALVHHFDDHDGGVNNMNKTFDKKAITLKVLNDYFPTYPMTSNGAWQKFSYGQADFFVLDVRSQRDPDQDPDNADKSMLDGDNMNENGQLQWFLNGLKNSTATWKVVFSGVPFNPTGGKIDSWSGFKTERTKIVDFIKGNNITGVVFVSGDEHGGAIDNGTNSSFPEILVPSPNVSNCFTTLNPGKWSNGIYGSFAKGPHDSPCPGYGTVRILTKPDRIVMKVRDDKGKIKLMLRHYLNPTDATKYANQHLDD